MTQVVSSGFDNRWGPNPVLYHHVPSPTPLPEIFNNPVTQPVGFALIIALILGGMFIIIGK
jgi:hypothetical protein